MKRPYASKKHNKRKKVSHSNEDDFITFEDAIKFFRSGHPKSSHADRYLKLIEKVAHSEGVSSEDITVLVDAIVDLRFKITVLKKLVYCLIPSKDVENAALVRIVYCIVNPVVPFSLKVDLVKWLCVTYEYIDTTILSCMYSLLFLQLQSDVMCPHVCQLLYRLTRAEHVTAYRIRFLVETQFPLGTQPCLLAVLQLYTNYRPDLVIVYCKYKKFFMSLGRLPVFIAQVKKSEVTSTSKKEHEVDELIVKKEITKFSHLSAVILSLKGNVGISNLLQSPMRRVLFTSGLPDTFMIRLRLFLRIALFTETTWSNSFLNGYPRDSLLPLLLKISSEIREALPEVLVFVAFYFKIWDGQKSFSLILDIIEYWEIRPFCDVLESVLNPLYKHYCYSSVKFKCSVISCLTNLYKNWVLYETPRFIGNTENLAVSPTYQKQVTVFEREPVLFDPNEQVQALAVYIDKLCTVSLHMHPDHPSSLLLKILKFYEMSLAVHEYSASSSLCLPSSNIICAWMFSSNAAILSGVCSLICRYRDELYRMRQIATGPTMHVEKLNSYISDICNMLGLCAAFKPTSISVFFHEKLPPALRKRIPRTADSFSIYRHPALFGFAVLFLEETEKGSLSLEMLLSRTRIRESYLRFLSSEGLQKIVTFLKTFIRTMGLTPQERETNRDLV